MQVLRTTQEEIATKVTKKLTKIELDYAKAVETLEAKYAKKRKDAEDAVRWSDGILFLTQMLKAAGIRECGAVDFASGGSAWLRPLYPMYKEINGEHNCYYAGYGGDMAGWTDEHAAFLADSATTWGIEMMFSLPMKKGKSSGTIQEWIGQTDKALEAIEKKKLVDKLVEVLTASGVKHMVMGSAIMVQV